jgi:hypothetical protein
MMQLLNTLPDVCAYAEVFQNLRASEHTDDARLKPPIAFIDMLEEGYQNKTGTVRAYLDRLAQISSGRPAFKVMYDQIINRPQIIFAAVSRRYKFIHLVRRNYLEIILSRTIAERTGIFHTTSDLVLSPIAISPGFVLRQIRNIDLQVRFFSALLKVLPSPCLTVSYESLVQDPTKQLLRMASFVGVTPPRQIDVSDHWKKGITQAPDQILSNFAEIRSVLLRSRFRYLVREQTGMNEKTM